MKTITLPKPDDFHTHLREGPLLALTVAHTARHFKRAVVMPNLKTPVCTPDQARSYKADIDALGHDFEPLMALYLTQDTKLEHVKHASEEKHIIGYKYYPASMTTNASAGVQSPENVMPILEALQKHDVPLLIHAESTVDDLDVFDREKAFLDNELQLIRDRCPQLRIIVEHITTLDAVQFVLDAPDNVAATITPHHLLLNRNDLLDKRLKPHHFCLPVLKHQKHQHVLLKAATSGDPKFFLGTDSAPHARDQKECASGCAGIYSAHAAIELYATVFDYMNALDKLEGFASHHGADFYRLTRNHEHITLVHKPQLIEASYHVGDMDIVPLYAQQSIPWSVQA